MENLGKPVLKVSEELEKMAKYITGDQMSMVNLDFNNTEIAFAHKTDKELKKAAWLFGLMNKHWLVGLGSKLGVTAIKLHLPFVEGLVKSTIFEQFCGGTTLLQTQKAVDHMAKFNVFSILDYGAEGKEKEEDFNITMNETIRAMEFASRSAFIPVVSTKVTGMARFDLLAAVQKQIPFTSQTRPEYRNVLKRMDAICHVASKHNIKIFFDAEESWIQDTIDHLVTVMMRRYNRTNVVVYNTFQMYRADRLQFLVHSYNLAKKGGYMLGAKLVRGAYMEKERERAKHYGYQSPIHLNKAATDDAFNAAVRFCVDNYKDIASCNASHNRESALLQAELIAHKQLPLDHPHLNFCQLYGMSDNLTFNLAKAGYNVAKYVPYGQVRDVVPYLIRRAQENSSITGDMSREYNLVHKEMKRRGIV